jgi:hypothetical protein
MLKLILSRNRFCGINAYAGTTTLESMGARDCYVARNQFREPRLELSRLAGRYDNPMPTWFLAPIAGHKLPTQDSGPSKSLKIRALVSLIGR